MAVVSSPIDRASDAHNTSDPVSTTTHAAAGRELTEAMTGDDRLRTAGARRGEVVMSVNKNAG
jgi:hypothetical protein